MITIIIFDDLPFQLMSFVYLIHAYITCGNGNLICFSVTGSALRCESGRGREPLRLKEVVFA